MTRLPDPDWLTAKPSQHVMAALNAERPSSARFVGGCVRNALLGLTASDIDIATQLPPDTVSRVLRAAGCAVHPTGIEHGTVTVVSSGSVFEVTTLRRDVETDGRRATVAFTEDWAEDAQRRDFTINSLYADASGEVFDPTGAGVDDIAAHRIVFVGDAETRIREDYLRILRFFRFFAWYGRGNPDREGIEACTRLAVGLEQISAERIWMELKKLVCAPSPHTAITAMTETGVMEKVMPEARHPERLERIAAMDLADGAEPDPLLRVLALATDGERALADFARRMKVSNEERKRLLAPLPAPDAVRPDSNEKALYRLAYRAGRTALSDRISLLRADQPDADAQWKTQQQRLAIWRRPELPVGGADVMASGVPEGPLVGPVLRAVEDRWVESDFTLSRAELLDQITEAAKEQGA